MDKIPGPKRFLIRDLHSKTLIGTASDRYAGWVGQDSKKRIAHSVRTTQLGILYLTKLVNLAAAAARVLRELVKNKRPG
jgi:hypothetical protein